MAISQADVEARAQLERELATRERERVAREKALRAERMKTAHIDCKTAPGPELDRCWCGSFAAYARNNFRAAPEKAEHFCARHAPPDLREPGRR